MIILVNASNLAGGGGPQVADSICRRLYSYKEHSFVVVLPTSMTSTGKVLEGINNIKLFYYDYPHKDYKSLITGRNTYLDSLVESEHINCVLSVFGPMKWIPRCPHLCGFALSQVVIPESPYFKRMSAHDRFVWTLKRYYLKILFGRSCSLYTENPIITERVQRLYPRKSVLTITNYYNQVFDQPERWKELSLPSFDGVQCLNITSARDHKNLGISLEIAQLLFEKAPQLKLRFVFTIRPEEFGYIPEQLKSYFYFTGPVSIEECPSLYNQCDIAFQPTLIECFTATYPEAMVMKKPIITTDLAFARSLCGKAALYYSPLSAQDAYDKIIEIVNNVDLKAELVNQSKIELQKFDNYDERVEKLIEGCKSIC